MGPSSRSSYDYGGCRLEQELQAASNINGEMRAALGCKPGESGVDKAKAAAEDVLNANAATMAAKREIDRLNNVLAKKTAFINEARDVMDARFEETVADAARRIKDAYYIKDDTATWYTNLKNCWERVAKAVDIDIDDNCDQTVAQALERSADVTSRLQGIYKSHHPHSTLKTIHANELIAFVTNTICRLGLAENKEPLPGDPTEIVTKVKAYDDVAKILNAEGNVFGAVYRLNRLKEEVERAIENNG